MIIESFSGIRGLFSPDLLDAAKKYAKAYADFLYQDKKHPTVLVGRDSRSSGLAIQDALCRVLAQEGITILLAGILPTPALEFGVQHHKLAGGIIITGSHNPPEYNGWKLLQPTGAILTSGQAQEVIAKAQHAHYQEKDYQGKDIHDALVKDYVHYAKKQVGKILPTTDVLFDANGGAAATILPELIEAFSLSATMINTTVGTFAHEIEPTQDALQTLVPLLQRKKIPFAFGFDCDADRVEIILADGNLINGNYILALIVDLILQESKGTVVTNDATSLLIRDVCAEHQCPVIEVEVGETNVVEKMNELKSPVGGEGSNGGVIIPPGQCRDGILTSLLILKLLGKEKKSLQELLARFPRHAQKTRKLPCLPEQITRINALLEKKFTSDGFRVERHGNEQGTVKAYKNNAFIFCRASRTEPGQFRIITDARDEQEAENLLQTAMRHFRALQAKNI
jgi:phosphomannomutase